MSFSIHEASAPIFIHSLTSIPAWLDKALAEGKSEAEILEARLAPDMRPFPAQIQMACFAARITAARLAGVEAAPTPDVEPNFEALKARCHETIAYIEGFAPDAFDPDRPIEVKLPSGSGYRFTGRDYLTGFALPNFFFHVTTAYALLRAAGVGMGKSDFLRHLGPPGPL